MDLSYSSLGESNCHRGEHQLNSESSRSHTVLTMTVLPKGGKITFVDLAGSERLKQVGHGSSHRSLSQMPEQR